eukprot:TRINITY_DN21549_c0_g1_i1.p1 TRINITY_DN21549_c0_g1~~TRINITY_DN21549_c0_g1_i1.p1  ORF type:complete len:430 (-),score=96.53 TRINITY_DN21549_c0_g1_i1:16-1305(-)
MINTVEDDSEREALVAPVHDLEEKRVTRGQVVTVVLLMLAFAFSRTAVFIQLLTTSLTAKSFLVGTNTPTQISTIPLAFLYYGGTFVAPFATKFMAKVGRRLGFITGCASGIFGAGIAILSTWLYSYQITPFWVPFLLLSLGSLFLGFANGFVNLFRFAAADAIPHRRSLAISAVLFGGDLAALVGPTLGNWTKNLLWTYGASYISLTILFSLSILTLFFIDIPALTKPDLSTAIPPRPLKELLRVPKLLLSLSTATVGFGMMVLLMVLIPLVLEDKFTLDETSHVLQVHSIGMFAPGLVIGFMIEYFGTLWIDLLGMFVLIAANVVMILGENYWNYMVGMFLLGVGWNFTFISSTTMLTTTYLASEKATTQGVNDFIMYFIVSSLSLASGTLWEELGSWTYINYLSLGVSSWGVFIIVLVMTFEKIRP